MTVNVSIIVLVWNGAKFLDACLSALIAQDYATCEVIVVDNDSKDESVATAEKYAPALKIIRNDYNLGYSAGNNVGISAAHGDVIILLNQDTVVQPGWLSAIVNTFFDPSIGIVGCKMLYPESVRFQHAGGVMDSSEALPRHIGWGEEDHGQYDLVNEPDFVTGAAFAIHRRVLEKLGALDEGYHPAFFEEIDYCYRARRAGYRIVYQPRAALYHHETTSLPADSYERASAFHRNRVRFVLRNWNVESLDRFSVAENAAIQASASLNDMIAKARGYWDNMLAVPGIALQREHDGTLGGALSRGNIEWILGHLQKLRAESHQRIVELLVPAITEPSASVEATSIKAAKTNSDNANWPRNSTNIDHIQKILKTPEAKSVLQEPIVNSRVPILGIFINGFRSLWYSTVLKHYLVPLMNQQSQFNEQLCAAVQDLEKVNRAQAQMFANQLQSQKTATDRELLILRARNAALVRIERILSADQAAVPEAILKLLDQIRSGK